MAKKTDMGDSPVYFYDDPDDLAASPAKKKSSGLFTLLVLLLGGAYFLQTTLAANISLGSNGPVEFGQGILQTTACSGSTPLSLTPTSSFVNVSGGGAYYFSSIKVSNIPSSCNGQDFTLRAYGETSSAQLALYNSTSTNAVVVNDAGTFQLGMGSAGMSITQSSGTFTVTFTTPVAPSSTVFRITIESGDKAESYRVGSIGPGGGKVFYVANTPFACGPTLNLTCSYLEAAPTTGTNSWVDANYLWSGNVNTAIGSSATGTAIGTGYRNTLAIVGQAGGGNTAGRAATVARAYRGPNNLTDWYLPSLDELTLVYQNQVSLDISNAFDDYWSSTEFDAIYAAIEWFTGDGSVWSNDKNSLNAVRPIRAF
jgi:hypothetical protein